MLSALQNKVRSEDEGSSNVRRLNSLLPSFSIGNWWTRANSEGGMTSALPPLRSQTSIMVPFLQSLVPRSMQAEVHTEEALIRVSQYKPLLRIDPDSSFKTHWDMFMLLLVYYVSLATPLSLAFFSEDQCDVQDILPDQVVLLPTLPDRVLLGCAV